MPRRAPSKQMFIIAPDSVAAQVLLSLLGEGSGAAGVAEGAACTMRSPQSLLVLKMKQRRVSPTHHSPELRRDATGDDDESPSSVSCFKTVQDLTLRHGLQTSFGLFVSGIWRRHEPSHLIVLLFLFMFAFRRWQPAKQRFAPQSASHIYRALCVNRSSYTHTKQRFATQNVYLILVEPYFVDYINRGSHTHTRTHTHKSSREPSRDDATSTQTAR